MKRRLLSLLLVLSMCMSMCVVCTGTASAATGTAAEGYYLATVTCYDSDGWEYFSTYTYDSNGNLLTKVEYSYGDSCTTTYTYDSNGNVLTYKYVDSYGTSFTNTYTYDNNGNLLTDAYESGSGSTSTTTYTYDSNGNLLTDAYESGSGSTYTYTYTYDSNGNMLTKTYENSKGTTYTWTYTYTYDSNGNVLTETYENGYGYSSTTTYTYDSYGNVLTETFENSQGTTTTKTYTYTYDNNGNMLTMACESSQGIAYTHTYTYDSSGNMLTDDYEGSGGYYSYTYTYNTLAELQSPFTDVKNESKWYFNAVMWAVEEGVTNGTSDTTFSPTKDCTRAEIVTFLWRAAGCPEPTSTENPFTDVKSGKYYYKAVLWAVEEGITTGTSSTTFSPNASCTRAEAVTFIYRYAKSPSVSATDKFTDVGSSKWYTSAVAWAVENSITSGTSSTTFSPNTTCSRAMIVTFLYRYCA